jgi:hypothetical protein
MTNGKKASRRVLVARVMGGLGNQLFIYAMARHLATRTGATLRLDHTSAFRRDFYRRTYMLNRFAITAGAATRWERFHHPGGGLRRKLTLLVNRGRPLERRTYLKQEGHDFDPRILEFHPRRHLTVEGYWQDERYFKDAAAVLRCEFSLAAEPSPASRSVARHIGSVEHPVCLHVRRLRPLPAGQTAEPEHNPEGLSAAYYRRAADRIAARHPNAHFFGFGDQPDWLSPDLVGGRAITIVSHNRGDARSHEDLWLMSLCRHFILANSSFSWWGAWLSAAPDKMVLAPSAQRTSVIMTLPSAWEQV